MTLFEVFAFYVLALVVGLLLAFAFFRQAAPDDEIWRDGDPVNYGRREGDHGSRS